ncbi:hypothetical protein GF324_09810 [bacterium]|nr:hypothetical protein [bacterium]
MHTLKSIGWTVLAALLLCTSCGADDDTTNSTSIPPYLSRHEVEYELIDEASGMAASRRHSGLLWLHNDSGDKPRLYAVDTGGRHRGVFEVVGAEAVDWEDMAAGPDPETGTSSLYLGDIGDNRAVRDSITVYRVHEPIVKPHSGKGAPGTTRDEDIRRTKEAETFHFRYPDGPRDAECLLVDPRDDRLYIISKREDSVGLYRAPADLTDRAGHSLEFLARLPLTQVTAGDIRSDGRAILLKTYEKVFWYPIEEGQSIADALAADPKELPYLREPQGEAIAFSIDKESYYTVSEERHGVPAMVYEYKNPTESRHPAKQEE